MKAVNELKYVIEFLTPIDSDWDHALHPDHYLAENLAKDDFRELLVDLCWNANRKDLAYIAKNAEQFYVDEYKHTLSLLLKIDNGICSFRQVEHVSS